MNKRFETLRKQAENFAIESVPYSHHNEIGGVWEREINRVRDEKFAELIIQECANYIRENLDNYDAEPLAHSMEVHFGVHGDYA